MTTTSTCLSFISGHWQQGGGNTFHAWDPVNNHRLDNCHSCTEEQLALALEAARQAADPLRQKSGADMAHFLRTLADEIEALGEQLITTAQAETGLPTPRLQGERGRTCGQIRAFAALVADGSWLQASIDTADPQRQPLPKPDVRATLTALGPIAVFGASNFPFAFGTLGGDTVSALAAGNPVIVKGHPSHPATSTLFARAMASAIEACQFPPGTFSLLQGNSIELGAQLVAHPVIKAVGFTGSQTAGRALMDIAAKRPVPITVYAEMGSINPLFIWPDALADRSEEIANNLAASITMGAGQFCTSPGLIVTLESDFPRQLAERLAAQPRGFMLNPGIAGALETGVMTRSQHSAITVLSGGSHAKNTLQPLNTLMSVSAADFIANDDFQHELFGPVALVVTCKTIEEMQQVAETLSGNLTATIHSQAYEDPALVTLMQHLGTVAGRVLFNGYPTGVEVCQSMQHGGPYPASSAPATTSVGTAAITRFTSRHAFQNCPDALLPPAIQDRNPLGLWRQVNGTVTQAAVNALN